MADTFGAMINRVLRATGQAPNKTQLSDLDDTQWVADRLNEAFAFIYGLHPFQIDQQATITMTPGTRLFPYEAGIDPNDIYQWSWRIQQDNRNLPLNFITKEALEQQYPDFETFTAEKPRLVYLDEGQIGFYPILNDTATAPVIEYEYPSLSTRFTAWSQTFPFADNSDELLFAEFFARAEYGYYKGLGTPDGDEAKAISFRGLIMVKYGRTKRQGQKGYRRFR